jgi:hypothetical protein
MKVLLDECIPRRLKYQLAEHECRQFRNQIWPVGKMDTCFTGPILGHEFGLKLPPEDKQPLGAFLETL